jgi:hypothetical protein
MVALLAISAFNMILDLKIFKDSQSDQTFLNGNKFLGIK